jgi:hypothetical protein
VHADADALVMRITPAVRTGEMATTAAKSK